MRFLPLFALFLSVGPLAFPDDGSATLEIIRRIPHSGYSEGLDYHQGYLWHALPKKIVKIDPKDGTVLSTFTPATEYSESIVWLMGKIWNVSFSDNGIYEGRLEGEKIRFSQKGTTPEPHAWGLATDGKHLIMTGHHRSKKLYFVDPGTGKLVRQITTPIEDLEDLAWDGAGLWTSSFTSHAGTIFRIDAKTGEIQGQFALPNRQECPVIDGIAYDGTGLWITGKECASIYYAKKPVISAKKRSVATPKASSSGK